MSTSVSDMLIEAKALSVSGDLEGAIRIHCSVIDIDSNNATSWYCLGVLYFETGLLGKSIEAFENSDRIYPNHPPTLANLAYLLEKEDPESASDYANAAMINIEDDEKLESISKHPKSSELEDRVFVEARQIEKKNTQDDDFSALVDFSERTPIDEARELTSTGQHSRAVAIWKGILEDSPNSPEVWRGLGEALQQAGYDDRAKQCMDRAKAIENEKQINELPEKNTDNERSIQSLAKVAEEAISRNLDNSNDGDLEDAIGWYNMGINLLNEGKNDEAISSFDKAIGGSPISAIDLKVKSQNGRGNALYNSGRFPESIVAYHTAIGLDPKSVSGRTLYNMGSSYAAVEMFDDAIKCFSQALERGLDKSDAELCEKQISRCRLLSREQSKRQKRVT